jgi:hypothetical protein
VQRRNGSGRIWVAINKVVILKGCQRMRCAPVFGRRLDEDIKSLLEGLSRWSNDYSFGIKAR